MIKICFFISICCFVFALIFLVDSRMEKVQAQGNTTFWKYQCIDTMKVSRDEARALANNPDAGVEIAWEMRTIKSLGANCVAIATPYDDEFLPYLNMWVAAARKENLHIWFRGNFSGWEGWFGYAKITDTNEYLTKLGSFIRDNPRLFKDGDSFTGAPEAENGGPFGQVNASNYPQYRQFLIDEYTTEQKAFADIHKNVQTNWFSMNGDVAKDMYDKATLAQIGNTITIDHYISSASAMSSFVQDLHNTYDANVMIGEFGAPIPDLNGTMTEDQQADFIDAVFHQLYENRDIVTGVNYWDLSKGTTALMNTDRTPRKAAAVIKKYFTPAVITGKVTDENGKPMNDVKITTSDNEVNLTTDSTGTFSFPTIADSLTITASDDGKIASASIVNITSGQSYEENFVLIASPSSIFEQIQAIIKLFFNRLDLQ